MFSESLGAGSQAALVAQLVRGGVLGRTSYAAAAMQKTDRSIFCALGGPYEDVPQPIGHGQTISAPHMHAKALSLLEPVISKAARTNGYVSVLDVGTGSGYVLAALGRLCFLAGASSCKLIGLETVRDLADKAEKNIHTACPDLAKWMRIVVSDGWEGWAEDGPYDVIHVGASAEVFPEKLATQLANGGRMLVPVGSEFEQTYLKCDKDFNGEVSCESVASVLFVPLVHTPRREL